MADVVVNIEELTNLAGKFATLTAESITEISTLVDGFAAYAGAWGQDRPGKAFEGAYASPAIDALDLVRQLPSQLAAVSSAMRGTAVAYGATETANVDLSGGVTA